MTRAITLASGLPYEEVREKLWLTASLFNCDRLCRFCYSRFLEDVLGFQQVDGDDMTVEEFADAHPKGTYLIRVPNHLTCIIDNSCYDIWNCLDEFITEVWRVD